MRLEKEMYKSGQRITFDLDTTPLSFDLNAPLTTEYDSEEDEENENNIVDNTSKLDYNYLMD